MDGGLTRGRVATLPVAEISFVKELYPRLKEDDDAIERYRASIEQLPPIITARGRILVDGFHRWQAHKRENITEIAVEDLGDLSDAEILEESYRRNARHGQQLSRKDKEAAACHLYFSLGGTEDERYATIADILSLRVSVAKKYAAEARADEQKRKQAKAWDLHLDCWTQQAIADEVGESQRTISNWIEKRELDSEISKAPGATADKPWGHVQHFDIWSFARSDSDSTYFGHMPPEVVENLLWYFTEPGQVVFDPFAGSGTTIKVSKAMGRRVWSSDRKGNADYPLLPIHEHDITTGWPKDAPAKADLIILDPPYWAQAAGKYSDSPDDMGNMDLDAFNSAWAKVVEVCAGRLTAGGHIAYIISPTQNEDGSVVDHATDMLTPCYDAGLEVKRRIIVPYQTQQATGQQVEWARKNKRMLKLYRDLVVLSA